MNYKYIINKFKNSNRGFLLLLAVITLLCSGISCSKAVKKESDVHTIRELYLGGIQKLKTDDINAAETDFKRAVELERKSPYGYTGLAFLGIKQKNYKEALKYVKKALKYDKNFTDAYAVKGYIICLRKHGEKWLEEAVEPLGKALELDPDNQQALFFLAECYLEAQQYEEAFRLYAKAMVKEGAYTCQAVEKNSLTGKIIEAAPVSEKGGHIALDDKIDRSDLCILLFEELKLKELIRERCPSVFERLYNKDFSLKDRKGIIPSDVKGHRTKTWILDTIQLHLTCLDVFPNGFYYPDKIMTRAQFAVVMQDIMAMVENDRSLSTIYIGTEFRFPDVHEDYYAFNGITLCVGKGIMEVNPDTGNFDSDLPVSGVDAILMLRALEKVLGK